MFFVSWTEACCGEYNCDRTENYSDTRTTEELAVDLALDVKDEGAWNIRVDAPHGETVLRTPN